jgi:ribosomal protein S14
MIRCGSVRATVRKPLKGVMGICNGILRQMAVYLVGLTFIQR